MTSKNQSELSMSAANSGILFPPFQILSELFTAAANIITDNTSVVKAPGVSNIFFVASKENPKKPHKVEVQKIGNAGCEYARYKAYSICAHSILDKYVKVVKRRRKRNVNDVLDAQCPKTAGKKAKKLTARKLFILC